MTTPTTDTKQGSSMSTAEIKAHIAAMFSDDRHEAPTAPRTTRHRSPGPRISA
ncbi:MULTISPECIES: hypothetical protein [Rhodococcus]|uniref:hypothetical protein n=1 Tax=Rhodococcus TaxID=1827 RepID=UPI000815DFBE|nr:MULTISPECIES: hypothetical protein [Rhodococcus]SCC64091.1 hypothetical protein GA0061093_11754 [Rhodococcus qingshengii]